MSKNARDPEKVSHHIARVGWHFRSEVVEQACGELQYVLKDGRYLIRFLSEIPYLPPELFSRIAKIAEDPERVQISTQALLYLIMLRPPVRERAIDCAAEMWRTNPDAKASVEKVLVKWRPEVVKEGGSGAVVKAEG